MLLFVDRLGSSVSAKESDCPFLRLQMEFVLFLRRFIHEKIGIVMGSDSDLPVLEKAMTTLDKFGVPYEVHVYSAHRTPVEAKEFAQQARANGFGAIIAAAGKAAHLAGAIAANTTLPVIGIPLHWTVWMHCFLLYRCPAAFPLQQ